LKGPELHAVLEINPQALALAVASDEARKTKGLLDLGPLHGIPILVKDNIATLHEEGTCVCQFVVDLSDWICMYFFLSRGRHGYHCWYILSHFSRCSILHVYHLTQDHLHFSDP